MTGSRPAPTVLSVEIEQPVTGAPAPWVWACGICGEDGRHVTSHAAAFDAIEHLNDVHARTLVGDGR